MRTSIIKKKLLLALLLATSSAWAGWVQVGQVDSSDFYIDPETIRKDGNLVKVWQMSDLKKQTKEGVLSRRGRFEYDCKQERFRTLSITTHSEPMAGGETLDSLTPNGNWLDIPPSSAVAAILKIVCR